MSDAHQDSSEDVAGAGRLSQQFKDRVREIAQSEDGLSTDDPTEHLRERKDLYEDINRSINQLKFGRFAHFMNFGYFPGDEPSQAVVTPGEGDFDRSSRQLILEVIGGCPVDDQDVLDVSCGRGALAVVLTDYFKPRSYLGIDFSAEAVAFCAGRHKFPGCAFQEGTAESLPVDSESFDVLVNVEASHLYHNPGNFYREVHRVLRPGGWFQYADIMSQASFDAGAATLAGLGMRLARDTDITSNVLASCADTAVRRMKIYSDPEERALMSEFLAAPGSEMYNLMKDGSLRYRIYSYQKPQG